MTAFKNKKKKEVLEGDIQIRPRAQIQNQVGLVSMRTLGEDIHTTAAAKLRISSPNFSVLFLRT